MPGSPRTTPVDGGFCLEVHDVDLANIDAETFAAIYKLWQENPLLLFRRQSLSEDELVDYSAGFGKLEHITREDMHSPLHPEVIYITSMRRQDGTPMGGLGALELYWHHDQIYREHPATGSIFYALEMPRNDGLTSFCNTQRAYDTLPTHLKERIRGRRATAKYGVSKAATFRKEFEATPERIKDIDQRTPAAPHPMVLTSPATGQQSLYCDPNKTIAIEGCSAEETDALIEEIFAHVLKPEFCYTHHWRNGDVVMWDNARLMHRRDAFDDRLPRFAKRTTIFLPAADFAVPEPDLARQAVSA